MQQCYNLYLSNWSELLSTPVDTLHLKKVQYKQRLSISQRNFPLEIADQSFFRQTNFKTRVLFYHKKQCFYTALMHEHETEQRVSYLTHLLSFCCFTILFNKPVMFLFCLFIYFTINGEIANTGVYKGGKTLLGILQ